MTTRPEKKIAILGFGRSGTTWVSDIVSKISGGLVLFEPMFPNVMPDAVNYCYINDTESDKMKNLFLHLSNAMDGKIKKKWLLRNHLNRPINEINDNFAENIWSNCNIIGFKEIRANFLLKQLSNTWDFKTVFIIRNPNAVISSLKNRPWFWKGDFGGLDNHYQMFVDRIIKNPIYTKHFDHIDKLDFKKVEEPVRKQAIIWAATHKIVLHELCGTNIPLLFYEDLFMDPFEISKKLMKTLDYGDVKIHPSYIFTPSMVTLKTTHDLHNNDDVLNGMDLSFFYENNLTNQEMEIIKEVNNIFSINVYTEKSVPIKDGLENINII